MRVFGRWFRLCLLASLMQPAASGAWAASVPTRAEPTRSAATQPQAGLAAARDPFTRLTIPVMVDRQGPFDFVVDTGADRSVISSELAERLKLPAGPPVLMHDTAGLQQARTVHIARLDVGERGIEDIEAPALARATLGADGMLGLDALHGQRVVMDFAARRFLSIASEAGFADDPGAVVVLGRRRFGRLVLVDADTRGTPIFVILDTGAQNTIGNGALRRLMSSGGTHPAVRVAEVISVTGGETPADLNEVPELHLGGLTIGNIPIAYADLHTFAEFGLLDRPAMLLGMDILRLFARVAVDFHTREVTFSTR